MAELSTEQIDKEIMPFLSLSTRPDVRAIAVQYLLGLTGSVDGQRFLSFNDKYITAIISACNDEQPAIAKDAYLALVNLSAVEDICYKLLSPEFLKNLISYVLKNDSTHADIVCMILSNLSRKEDCAQKIVDLMINHQEEIGFDKVITVFCQVNYNKHANLHYLGPFLSNLTQIQTARYYILDKERCVIQRLLPFTQYLDSLIRRGGVVGTLKNCCFEIDYHEWLLSDKVDILPWLLLPLAGPEEFDEDDMERLPVDLQYLEPDKEREPDPDIRKMLVECIHQLLATKLCRQHIRDKNAYVILRELDNWENDPACTLVIHNTISILIADEPEPGMEDLHKVIIPDDIKTKLEKAHELEQKELEEQMKQQSTEPKDKDK